MSHEEDKTPGRLAGPLSKKCKFTKLEDEKLKKVIEEVGEKDWNLIAKKMAPRTARQCRERWTNYINPEISKTPWTQTEDDLLLEKQMIYGNHWKEMVQFFPNRSKNSIKLRYTQIKNKVKPIDDLIPMNMFENDFDFKFSFDQDININIQPDLWTFPIDNSF